MRDSLENEIPHIKFKNVSFSYPGEKENLIFNIMKIIKNNKSEFAYPSTSLYVESMPK